MDSYIGTVRRKLRDLADPEKASGMAAYMKTTMPFYGVQKKGRRQVLKSLLSDFPASSAEEYVAMVEALWGLSHREEKYLAIDVAMAYPEYITTENLTLYERLIREGAWWDLVDSVAANLVGRCLLEERPVMSPVIEKWVDDEDMWIRRTALISHLHHKERTDYEQLFDHCLRRAAETEFFIRKAIGWALREYAKTAPERVRGFVLEHRDQWAGLTFREAMKHL